jgi:hypothetical protein
MSYFRVDEWCEPSRPDEEFRRGTLLGPTSLLFTGSSSSGLSGPPGEAASDRWLLELLGDDQCVRVLIAEGEEE